MLQTKTSIWIYKKEGLDIWNLPHVEGGDDRFIRREYVRVNDLESDRKDGGWDAVEDEPQAQLDEGADEVSSA